jgi:hypothetical protein
MNVDLHCHSNVSDGALAPGEVVRRAAAQGVELLALTDHDQLGGLAEARDAAHAERIGFIDGVEISVTWRGVTLHVVGLGVDPADDALAGAMRGVRAGRLERARAIARSLADAGVPGDSDAVLEGALRHARDPSMIGRTHFARYLAEAGVVADGKAAFRSFLVPGKPGYIAHEWAALDDALRWIRGAGGAAVLAHPGRYGLSPGAMNDLLGKFRAGGGAGLEAVTGSHAPDQYRVFATLAAAHGLALSRGSDFHGPGEGAELGSLPAPALPGKQIWRGWRSAD